MKRFHKVLFVLAILIANCISASAIEFTVDGVRYSVNNDSTTVMVAGYPSGSKPTGDLTIPESVTYGDISYPVTSIGDYAFVGCSGLTSVTIPNSVTSIGEEAFYNCSGLTSVTIGNSVTSIGYRAFYDCSNLKSVTIGNSVTSIGNEAFWSCSGLTSVVWNAKSCRDFEYDSSLFSVLTLTKIKTFEFGSEVERIPAYLCYKLTGLKIVTIPNSVTEIGNDAFCGCSGLTSLTIGNSVTSIGNTAFSHCSGLTSVTIPNSVTEIGNNAFVGCTGLTSVNIPNSVTAIGDGAFKNCSGLTSVNIPNSVTSIGDEAFCECSGLTSVTIGNSVTSIGYKAFSGCSGLTSVVWNAKNCRDFEYNSSHPFNGLTKIKIFEFGNEVEKIPAYLCYKLTGLKIVTIGNSVTSICDYAFGGCSGLTSVTIPNSVTSIGTYAFGGCSGLTRIDAYPNPEKISIRASVFSNVPKDWTLHVPPKYLSAYQTASQWCEFTNIKSDLTEIGDINLDGKVDVADVTTLMNMILN